MRGARADDAVDAPRDADGCRRPKVNILVVDDRPEKLLALETVLASLDENVVAGASGREALR